MALSKQKSLTISSMTVLELSELIKAMEEKFGVSAAAAVAVAGPAAAARRRRRRRADRIHRHARRVRREQGQRHQGGARTDGPRPEGSQGPGRRRAEGREGSASSRPTPKQRRRSSKTPAPRSRSSNTAHRREAGGRPPAFLRLVGSPRQRAKRPKQSESRVAVRSSLSSEATAGRHGLVGHRGNSARCRQPAVGSGQPPSRGARSRTSR